MAAEEGDVVAERHELVADGVEQCVRVAIGEVDAADGALEEHVADHGDRVGAVDEDDVAGRMAGAVQDVEVMAGELEAVAFGEEPVGANIAGAGDAEALALGLQLIEQEGVARVRAFERDGERLAQLVGATGVIDMPVGEQDPFDGQAEFGDGLEDARDVAAGSITQARLLASSQSRVQFCCNGVTGTIAPRRPLT